MNIQRIVSTLLCAALVAEAGIGSNNAAYVGGTVGAIPQKAEGKLDLGETEATFKWKNGSYVIPYAKIDTLEFGQKAGRRVGVAVVVNPVFLLSKKRKHYLTVNFKDATDKQNGVVFELGKNIVRTSIVMLEARTGKKVEYDSEESRKNAGN